VFQRIRAQQTSQYAWALLLLTTIIAYHSILGFVLTPEALIHPTLWPWVVFFNCFELRFNINDAAIRYDPTRSAGICFKFILIFILLMTWISAMKATFSGMLRFHISVWPPLAAFIYISFMKFLCRNGIIQ
jgi:hypothetical protein